MRAPWAQLLSLVALATPFSRPATTSAAEVPTFAALVIGESAEIAYRSVGPKGTVERTLVVAPESWGFQVTPRSDGGGTLVLAEKDVEGLDRLLALYRNPRTGTCERRDEIGIVWKRAEARIADEAFVDLSCSAERTCGVLPLTVVAAMVFRTPLPDSTWGKPCNIAETTHAVGGYVTDTLGALGSGDGFARVIGFGLLAVGLVVLAIVLIPVVTGLVLGRSLLGLAGSILAAVAFVSLVPSPAALTAAALVVVAFTSWIAMRPRRASGRRSDARSPARG